MKLFKAVIFTKHYESMKSKVPSYELTILGRRIIDYTAKTLQITGIREIEYREENERVPGALLYVSASAALLTRETIESLLREENSYISDGESLLAFYANEKFLHLNNDQIRATPAFSKFPVDECELCEVSDRLKLYLATEEWQKRINSCHLENGVSIVKPDMTFISPDTVIGQDTTILPNTYFYGKCIIGQDCAIGPNVSMTDMIIGDNVKIADSTLSDSEVGHHTAVGPYACVRPGSKIGSHVKIGDFVEVKNSVIGDYTKASHLTYIGDADVGLHVNFGCGTVTGNYDGKKKHRTVINDNVFIGCNTNLVAPVTVGEGAYTAAGSTITTDVPAYSLAVARARQVNKEGWSLGKK